MEDPVALLSCTQLTRLELWGLRVEYEDEDDAGNGTDDSSVEIQ